jgi:hypothetical protein
MEEGGHGCHAPTGGETAGGHGRGLRGADIGAGLAARFGYTAPSASGPAPPNLANSMVLDTFPETALESESLLVAHDCKAGKPDVGRSGEAYFMNSWKFTADKRFVTLRDDHGGVWSCKEDGGKVTLRMDWQHPAVAAGQWAEFELLPKANVDGSFFRCKGSSMAFMQTWNIQVLSSAKRPANEISAESMAGIWYCWCPLGSACYKKVAKGPDNLFHVGLACLFGWIPIPFSENRVRLPGTNNFVKVDDPGNVDSYSSSGCTCNGLSCGCRCCPG